MAEYTPSYIGVGPLSTGFGVPDYNKNARSFGISQSVDLNEPVSIPSFSLATSLSPRRVMVMEDFLLDAAATLPKPWGKVDVSSTGTPTHDYIADSANGLYRMKHDATNELQSLTLHFADQLVIDPTKDPIFECRLKIDFAGATFSADQRIVIGLAAARNATLDSNTHHAWFRIEGANLNILCETDDGTTDNDDKDTGYDIVDNTFTTFRIDMSDLSDIRFYVDGKLAQLTSKLSASAMTASNLLQPYIEIQKDAGTETEDVVIDYVAVEFDRV